MINNLTEFQLSMRIALDAMFSEKGISLIWEIRGEKERFYYGASLSDSSQLWLYEDEAEFRQGTYHLLCERPAFPGIDQLKEFFLASVRVKLA